MRAGRGNCIVKRVETAETLSGGKIIIPAQARERFTANQFEVVDCGEPEICEDEDCGRKMHGWNWTTNVGWEAEHPLDHQGRIDAGAWVLIEPRSLIDSGDGTHFFVRQSDIAAIFLESEGIP